MKDLPHDILAQIFLCSPLTLQDSLAISAVSRRLRRAALDMPLLWSTIEVSGERGLPWLVLVLARSRDALLDVVLCPQGRVFGALGNEDQRPAVGVIIAALLPHVARLRSLCAYLYELEALIPLLDANLPFDQLVELVVHGGTPDAPFRISGVTPQLQFLDLRQARARNWCSVLTANLTKLTLDLGTVTADFMDLLVQNCSNTMRQLAFTDCERGRDTVTLNGHWIFAGLQHLELYYFVSSRALELLQSLPTAHIPYVFLSLANNIDSELLDSSGPDPLMAFLLNGFGAITEFRSHYDCTLFSHSGKSRRLSLAMDFSWDLGREKSACILWTCLCNHFDAQQTVGTCALVWREWDRYRTAFLDRPPLRPRFLLRVYTDYHTRYYGALEFPTLANVVLTGTQLGLTGLKGFVLGLVEEAIECSSSSEVQLCVCDAVSPGRLSLSETCAALEAWIRRKTGGPWSTTRWFVCPGNCHE